MLFLDPQADPDAYYNIEQALISIGSGGLLGKGFSIGTQNQLHFLRVRHTDLYFLSYWRRARLTRLGTLVDDYPFADLAGDAGGRFSQ